MTKHRGCLKELCNNINSSTQCVASNNNCNNSINNNNNNNNSNLIENLHTDDICSNNNNNYNNNSHANTQPLPLVTLPNVQTNINRNHSNNNNNNNNSNNNYHITNNNSSDYNRRGSKRQSRDNDEWLPSIQTHHVQQNQLKNDSFSFIDDDMPLNDKVKMHYFMTSFGDSDVETLGITESPSCLTYINNCNDNNNSKNDTLMTETTSQQQVHHINPPVTIHNSSVSDLNDFSGGFDRFEILFYVSY